MSPASLVSELARVAVAYCSSARCHGVLVESAIASGCDPDALERGLRHFDLGLHSRSRQNSVARGLRALGLYPDGFGDMDTIEALESIAKQVKWSGGGFEEEKLAALFFGRAGHQLLPFLSRLS